MKRLLGLFLALTLGLFGLAVNPGTAAAAPLPATYSGSAGGDIVAIDLDVPGGVNLAAARLAVTESTATGGAAPESTSSAANLGATVLGLDIAVRSDTQTAPPDHPDAETGTIATASVPGLLDLGALTTSVQARAESVVACSPAGGVLADSGVRSVGSTVEPTDVGNVVTTGDSSTRGVVALVPEPAGSELNRAVQATASGTITGTSFLDGDVSVEVAGTPTLSATATGEAGGAEVAYEPGIVTVTALGETVTVELGAAATFTVPGGQVTITVNRPTVTEAADGRTAAGAVAVVSAAVTVGTAADPLATATVELLPLRAEAAAPAGGIDCPAAPPVLVDPADGSSTADTTPTFTGTAEPGAEVEIFVDGDSIGTTTADDDGDFSFTPTDPLLLGERTATAVQTTDDGVSGPSAANEFTIIAPAPVLLEPADGSSTADTTPAFRGTAVPAAQVEIFVDGNSIGTTTAEDDGSFSFTPAEPLAPGLRSATAVQAVDGGVSEPSAENEFTVTADQPAAPVLVEPTDGSATDDVTPTFTGTAEPGAAVEIFVDGDSIGTTTADEDGDFSFTPAEPLARGLRSASAAQTTDAGTSEPSAENEFTVTAEQPAAPVLVTPADGSTTDDATPTFTGTAEPGAEVEIFVGGDSIGTTTADDDGNFSFTPDAPLLGGPHTATAVQTTDGGTSEPSAENGFRVTAGQPARPVITSPTDGSTTTDPNLQILGTAEPGSEVVIIVDGRTLGSTIADENGDFSFRLAYPLAEGQHEILAVALDAAGNQSERSEPVVVTVLGAALDGSQPDGSQPDGSQPGGSQPGDSQPGGSQPGGSGPGRALASTGGPTAWVALAAILSLVGGAAALAGERRRKRA